MRGRTARLAREALRPPVDPPEIDAAWLMKEAGMGKSRGSEERLRTALVGVRLLPAEKAALAAAADEAGMAVGCYVRHQVFGTAGPRAKRRPTISAEGVARLLGAVGKLGSNVNQMAKVANAEGQLPTEDRLSVITAEVMDMRNALLEALGRRP